MSKTLTIVGIGPGEQGFVTPEVSAAIARATDAVGYIPILNGCPHALIWCAIHRTIASNGPRAPRVGFGRSGGDVVVVSSGDPSVFAMSAAVFEAMETRLRLGRMLTSPFCLASQRCWRPLLRLVRPWA